MFPPDITLGALPLRLALWERGRRHRRKLGLAHDGFFARNRDRVTGPGGTKEFLKSILA